MPQRPDAPRKSADQTRGLPANRHASAQRTDTPQPLSLHAPAVSMDTSVAVASEGCSHYQKQGQGVSGEKPETTLCDQMRKQVKQNLEFKRRQ